MKTTKRLIALLLAVISLSSVFVFSAPAASAATSSALAAKIKSLCPIQCYAMPASGASRVYAYNYSNGKLGSQQWGYYIDSFSEQIVITDISSDGSAVKVRYLSSKGAARDKWFRTDDILGLNNVALCDFQANAAMTVYRMRSSSSVTKYGSVSKGSDICYKLGSRNIGGNAYNTVIYKLSSAAYVNGISVKHKMGLVNQSAYNSSAKTVGGGNSNQMVDVTASFAGKQIKIRSVQNGKYLCADSSQKDTPAMCNKSNVAVWETFTVTVTSDGWAGFKAHNGKWLSALNNVTNTPIRAAGNNLCGWECFKILQRGSDYFIKAQVNSKYLCVRVDLSGAPTQCCAAVPSTWERVAIEVIPDTSFNPVWPCESSNYISTMYRYWNGGNIKNHGVRSNIYNAFDISGEAKDVIYAVEKGTVVDKGYQQNGFGYYVVIEHNNGLQTLYGHLKQSASVSIGQTVYRKQAIGHMGSSGNSSGNHLHFEMFNPKDKAIVINPWVKYYQGKVSVTIGGNSYKANSKYSSDSYAASWCNWLKNKCTPDRSGDYVYKA